MARPIGCALVLSTQECGGPKVTPYLRNAILPYVKYRMIFLTAGLGQPCSTAGLSKTPAQPLTFYREGKGSTAVVWKARAVLQ